MYVALGLLNLSGGTVLQVYKGTFHWLMHPSGTPQTVKRLLLFLVLAEVEGQEAFSFQCKAPIEQSLTCVNVYPPSSEVKSTMPLKVESREERLLPWMSVGQA